MLTVHPEIRTTAQGAGSVLESLRGKLVDRTPLNKSIAAVCEILTRRHIAEVAAPSRHRTANALGATPTGYLREVAEATEGDYDANSAVVKMYGDILRRVLGDVVVLPVKGKFLTIPATAEAYGRRAGEIQGLAFGIVNGRAALVREGQPIFWLVRRARLRQDDGLIPTDEQYANAAELGAREYLEQALQ
jgi:hypothetical protein